LTPINERIITVKFCAKPSSLTVIQCYASTNDSEDNTKEEFYDVLHEAIRKCKKHGILLVQGDFNS